MRRKILVVEDFEPFRRWVCSTLQHRAEFQVTDVSDGLQAVQRAKNLQPDLILLDIGLPKLNGLEVARQVREVAPLTKILFLSQESSPEVVREALDLGGFGYVHKPRAHGDLLLAVDAVLGGRPFVSGNLEFGTSRVHRHEALFCTNDDVLIDGLTRFIVVALNEGSAVIVLVTEAHRNSLLQNLRVLEVDIPSAIERGTFVLMDVHEALSMFMVNDWPDEVRLSKGLGDLIVSAARGAKGEIRRVLACGECAPTLLAQGKAEAAIEVEHLSDRIMRSNGVGLLCVYLAQHRQENNPVFKSICAAHSSVVLR